MVKIQTKFILFIVVIHSVTIALSFLIFKDNKLLFIGSEVFIIISLFICWSLYSDLIQPLQLLMTGIDALHDKGFNVKFVKTGKYEMDELITIYNTMIDQLRTERTLQQEQHFFLEKLIQTSPIGIIILDFDENIAAINPKALAFLNRKEAHLIGQSIHQLDNSFCRTIAMLKKNDFTTLNTEGVKKFKIQKTEFIDRGFARSFIMIEELTMEIFEAEKYAYGKVIRMMAHEVNNSIGAVNSILDTSFQMERDADVANALKVAMRRNDHLNHFMRNFADIIRLPEPHKETLDLIVLIKNVMTLMEYKAKEKGIRFEFAENDKIVTASGAWQEGDIFSIKADVGQLEQVLINIVKNGIEAIDNQGIIKFQLNSNPQQLCIYDTGKGIPKAIEHKLFSPFFTDKNGGQGIGLTLTREILTKHGFRFSLHNKESGGAIFKIVFQE